MKHDAIIIGLLALLVGLFMGYLLSPQGVAHGPGMMYGNYEYRDEMMDLEEDVHDENGLMSHVMDEMMLGLRGKHGEEYEEAFLNMMITHHEGAIEMAEELLNETDRPELVEMANNIIEVQSQEIEMMEEWRTQWFNQ